MPCSSGSQKCVQTPAIPTLPANLLELKFSGPTLDLLSQKLWDGAYPSVLLRPPYDSHIYQHLTTIVLEQGG